MAENQTKFNLGKILGLWLTFIGFCFLTGIAVGAGVKAYQWIINYGCV